jgi:hypothetical protein
MICIFKVAQWNRKKQKMRCIIDWTLCRIGVFSDYLLVKSCFFAKNSNFD